MALFSPTPSWVAGVGFPSAGLGVHCRFLLSIPPRMKALSPKFPFSSENRETVTLCQPEGVRKCHCNRRAPTCRGWEWALSTLSNITEHPDALGSRYHTTGAPHPWNPLTSSSPKYLCPHHTILLSGSLQALSNALSCRRSQKSILEQAASDGPISHYFLHLHPSPSHCCHHFVS